MASPSVVPRKLWEHPNPEATNMAQFMRDVNKKRGLNLKVTQTIKWLYVVQNKKTDDSRPSKTYTNGHSTNAQTSGPISSHYTL